jgi:hypothetical protein
LLLACQGAGGTDPGHDEGNEGSKGHDGIPFSESTQKTSPRLDIHPSNALTGVIAQLRILEALTEERLEKAQAEIPASQFSSEGEIPESQFALRPDAQPADVDVAKPQFAGDVLLAARQ